MTTTTLLLLFLAGFVALIVGAELLVRGASRLAIAVGISPLVVGLTVVAYGTSAPELAVVIQAVQSDPPQPDLAVGNVVGSNISNVLLVLGISALALPLIVSRVLVRVTVPFMIAVTGLVWYLSLDGVLSRVEGWLLVAGSVLFTLFSVIRSRRTQAASAASRPSEPEGTPLTRKLLAVGLNLVLLIAGLGLLVLGARWLVEGATEVARLLRVSELIVGLTVVAVGTSLPEIATSLIATVRGQREIAVGNVVGSNIFNLLLVLGVCAALSPQPLVVSTSALRFDIPIMFAVTAACWPIFFTEWVISRWEGLAFLAFYAAYILFLYLQATAHDQLDHYRAAMIYFVLPLTVLVLLICSTRHWRNPAAGTATPQR
jgi:cation:H+ antiporter